MTSGTLGTSGTWEWVEMIIRYEATVSVGIAKLNVHKCMTGDLSLDSAEPILNTDFQTRNASWRIMTNHDESMLQRFKAQKIWSQAAHGPSGHISLKWLMWAEYQKGMGKTSVAQSTMASTTPTNQNLRGHKCCILCFAACEDARLSKHLNVDRLTYWHWLYTHVVSVEVYHHAFHRKLFPSKCLCLGLHVAAALLNYLLGNQQTFQQVPKSNRETIAKWCSHFAAKVIRFSSAPLSTRCATRKCPARLQASKQDKHYI